MPLKPRKESSKKNKELKWKAMADCVLLQEIMLCILTRLPLKSLIHFKCVCKKWCKLFAKPKFVDQLSNKPTNEAFIIDDLAYVHHHDNSMPLFSIDSNVREPTNLDFPVSMSCFIDMGVVGCCNGLVCLAGYSMDRKSMEIILWNPGLRLMKFVSTLEKEFGCGDSIGFGYDSVERDFKVVRFPASRGRGNRSWGHLYSAKSDSWKAIEMEFPKYVSVRNDAIVNGNPHWILEMYGDENERVLVWFDVEKLEFKRLSLLALKLKEWAKMVVVDWKGSLAVFVCTEIEPVNCFAVWVFDDVEIIWKQNHALESLVVDRCVQCSKDGKVIGASSDGKVFVLDIDNTYVKEIRINKDLHHGCKRFRYKHGFKIFRYNESLEAYIKGMVPV